jgi:hypothetical protein
MEKSRPWPEEGVQGCDVGDLQQMTWPQWVGSSYITFRICLPIISNSFIVNFWFLFLSVVVSCCLLWWNNLRRDNLKERFILAHSFRGFCPWSLAPCGEASWQKGDRGKLLTSWQPESRETGQGIQGQDIESSAGLLSTRPRFWIAHSPVKSSMWFTYLNRATTYLCFPCSWNDSTCHHTQLFIGWVGIWRTFCLTGLELWSSWSLSLE